MVLAASIAVKRTSDAADTWRGWVDHTLLILMIAALTWLLTSLVRVAERRMIARYGGGGDGDLRRRPPVAAGADAGDGAAQARDRRRRRLRRGRDPDDVPVVLQHRHDCVRFGRCAVRGRRPGRADLARRGVRRHADRVLRRDPGRRRGATRERPVVGPHRGDHPELRRRSPVGRAPAGAAAAPTSPPNRSRTGPAAPPRSWAPSSSTSTSPSRSATCAPSWTGCWPKASCGTADVACCR